MKKHVWIVPILLFLFPVPTVSVCSKVHSKNESTGSGNFECVNGGCWIQIDPSPTKGIELTLQGKGNKLLIYMITSGKQKQEFLQRESEKTDERYYLADVGQGFSIKWNESCNSDTGAPHYTFDRAILDPYYCGPYLRYIGNEVVTIQKERRAKSQFYCRYHMVPLNSNISSETIYVISGAFDTFEVLDGNNEPYTITGTILSRNYWKYIDFEKRYSGTRNKEADLEYIYMQSPQTDHAFVKMNLWKCQMDK
ncbi:hypothetical protein B9Z55_023232 [Caenorhabditis nigoni]|uniref:Uncharacterized protein n=1 Tax=Caenorhabditis nigoni TaxID=1611254 RepID=A0A2G5SP18_9PELO|nr:hypothetical protein B9Z55_023232 [Caenorhabditis nigoni]